MVVNSSQLLVWFPRSSLFAVAAALTGAKFLLLFFALGYGVCRRSRVAIVYHRRLWSGLNAGEWDREQVRGCDCVLEERTGGPEQGREERGPRLASDRLCDIPLPLAVFGREGACQALRRGRRAEAANWAGSTAAAVMMVLWV